MQRGGGRIGSQAEGQLVADAIATLREIAALDDEPRDTLGNVISPASPLLVSVAKTYTPGKLGPRPPWWRLIKLWLWRRAMKRITRRLKQRSRYYMPLRPTRDVVSVGRAT